MRDPELDEIKALRRRLGLTQQALARAAGVSQSMIAKIEAGTLDPGFTTGKKILNVLRSFAHEEDLKARDIMQRHIISVTPESRVKAAVKKMERYAISQLPVMKEGVIVGLLTEKTVLQHLEDLHEETIVAQIMEDAPPIVPGEAPMRVVSELLTHYNLVLVKEHGRLRGLITKADLLRKVTRTSQR